MAVESLELGTQTYRARDNPPPAIPPGPTIAAFAGRTERGPINEAIAVTSFDEYRRVFGEHMPPSSVSHAVQHYFLHGGAAAYVVRLVNGARRAALDVPAGRGALRLIARQAGSREHLRVSIDYHRVEDDPQRFNLVVQRTARPGSQLIEDQELYANVSLDPNDRRFIIDALRDSELVQLEGPLPFSRPSATVPEHPGEPIPYLDFTEPGKDGDELTDYDIIGSDEEGTGLFALDGVPRFDLLCVPPPCSRDYGSTALLAAARYCRRRHAVLIWDPPKAWQTSEAVLQGVRSLGLTSRNAMTYVPRLRPRGQFARFPAGLPACGALAGLLAAGDAVHGHPSGAAGKLKASLTTLIDLNEREAATLRGSGVNPLVRVSGGGVSLDGNACLAPQDNVATAAQRLDASRATLYVLDTLERSTRWGCGAAAEPETARRLERQARALLNQLLHRGVLAGGRSDEAFVVRAVQRGEGATALRIGFAVLRPGQFQIYEIEYRSTGPLVREMPPLDAELAE